MPSTGIRPSEEDSVSRVTGGREPGGVVDEAAGM